MRFRNRGDAGRQLAGHLAGYAGRGDVIVLALPRGGVPVAAEVAARLKVPLDVFLVRKIGVPGHPELAMGAIAEGGVEVVNERLLHEFGIPRRAFSEVAAREHLELDRRDRQYRGARRLPSLRGRTVILVDDGLATGATMEAGVVALRAMAPARIVVAAPVGAVETCQRLGRLADEIVCPATPDPFDAVGLWYDDFSQTTDREVIDLLSASGRPPPASDLAGDPLSLVRLRAIPLSGSARDYDRLVDEIGSARVVMLGEATHGTHEFYRERAMITRRLIVDQGFAAIAVEADWPDAYRVNRYVRGEGDDEESVDALDDFRRFPTWMWRNAEILEFVGWLRARNDGVRPERRAGFYGLDLYSLRASMGAVLHYLDKVDPAGARRARAHYACFDQFGEDLENYARIAGGGWGPTCEGDVVAELVELNRRRVEYARRDGRVAADEFFFAQQNARLVTNAEAYYRAMFRSRVESWNLRDRHMADTLVDLVTFLERDRPGVRVVVWAHNSHVGDARATEMGEAGEWNVGQLARQRFGADAVNVGFTTHHGTVTAASGWDGPAHRRTVRPALAASYERLFHDAAIPRFLLPLRTDVDLASALSGPRLERAIGVIYVPESERRSHYFHARLPEQFDYVLHFDETRAVEPLERTRAWDEAEVAETYPSGL
jgi:erythromycin esterase-like protein/predicted phosphoribosyltransferase